MMDLYGTLGPACDDEQVLEKMFSYGMNGVRLNLSHTTLLESKEQIARMRQAAEKAGVQVKFVIDLQGPELRCGKLAEPMQLKTGQNVQFGVDGIPIPDTLYPYLKKGQQFSMDDGKLLFEVNHDGPFYQAEVLRGGVLSSHKSITLEGIEVDLPVLTKADEENLDHAAEYGVYGVMQSFARSGKDVEEVRKALHQRGLDHVKILAKVENASGLSHLDELIEACDELVIARGDLGNAMPLWHLARVQKEISERCLSKGRSFMVVTQMLASMTTHPYPTRAEVSDVFHAVTDGASSIMVTGETASGNYPAEVIRYLANTAREAQDYLMEG